MSSCTRILCRTFRVGLIGKVNLPSNILGIRKAYFVPRAPEGLDLKEFKVFYSFPALRVISAISSRKYLKTAACLALSCCSLWAYKQNIMSEDMSLLIITIGIYSILLTHGFSYLARNLVGKMYTNKSRSHIVISALNSKGNRINNTYETDKVLLSDHPNSLANKYFKQITCEKESVKYSIYCHRGMQFDFFVFTKIFPNFE